MTTIDTVPIYAVTQTTGLCSQTHALCLLYQSLILLTLLCLRVVNVSRHFQTGISPPHTKVDQGTITKMVTTHVNSFNGYQRTLPLQLFVYQKPTVELIQPRCAFPTHNSSVLTHSGHHFHTFMIPYSHEFHRL